ncbi:hypothetical protein [Streptomyces sp. NPDC059165]|uniref:hypothetical protein n=1 Tax=Streptomyces sp. NPDC059165 TaxID=3346751 RepID=UPI00368CBB23
MAGESPDKSEQQKSSGATTPGERDPRLAVARSEGAPAEGRVDQATAVFRTQSAPSEPSSSDNGQDAGETGSGSASGSASAPDSGSGSRPAAGASDCGASDRGASDRGASDDGADRDARLRAAVAAWVSTGGKGDDGATGGAVTGASGDVEQEASSGAAPEAGEGASDGSAEGPGGTGPDAGADVSGDEAVPAESAEDVPAEPEGHQDSTPGQESAAARGSSSPSASAPRESEGTGSDGPDGGPVSDEGTPEPESGGGPERGTDGTVEETGRAGGKAAATAAGPRAEGAADGAPGDEPKGKVPSWAASRQDATVPTQAGQDQEAEDQGAEEDEPEPERSAPGGTGRKDGPSGRAEPVDQSTAVFTKLPRPAVDQPTTALKITAPSPAEPTSAPAGKPGAAPESDAERTSTFVPLRRDDVRPAKPAPPSPAASGSAAARPAVSGPAAARPAASDAPEAPASLDEPERTRQQPLPPKPPLDLLAELTNTPPPPQTPVRTAVRRVKIWTPLAVLLLIVFAVVQAVRPLPDPVLNLTAKPTYSFEGSAPQLPWPAKGQSYMAASGLGTLGSSGEQKPVPIASVTKSMTAYVILKEHPLKPGENGPMIEIDAKAEAEGQLDKTDNESTLNTVKKGDKISLKDALSAIMIPSANNIARLLARWDAGSEEAFVEKMNATAKDLGMKNTTYTDPSGLNATTVSTAEDQVKLGLELVEIKALMNITRLPHWVDPTGTKWRNWNDLVPFNGSLGIKTGSTTKAGGNLLFAAHKMVGDTDQLIVGAVLAQYDTPILGTAINASKELMIATQDALKSATVVKKGQVVGTVDDGLGGSVPVVATKDVAAVGWSGLTVKLKLTNGGKALPHGAKAGAVVGSLTVGEGASQVTVPVALQDELVEPGFGAKLTRLG